ncbi:MAG: cysteine hydrolase [Oscillospiraceae bacterium]|nr:cysteine hydrolase [Oscillospiraceae bacterium]
MKKALLVIDMQEFTVGKAHADLFKYDDGLIGRVNAVISSTDADKVVYIKHLMKRNLINKFAPFQVYEGDPRAELAEDLRVVSSDVFTKYAGDAFSVPVLCSYLKENDIDTVELIGVDGGGCVSLTALGAFRKGYNVILDTSAIGIIYTAQKERYFKKLSKLGADFIG